MAKKDIDPKRSIDKVKDNIFCCNFFHREYVFRHILISDDGELCKNACSILVEKIRSMISIVGDKDGHIEYTDLIYLCDRLLEHYFLLQSNPVDDYDMDFDQIEISYTKNMLMESVYSKTLLTSTQLGDYGIGLIVNEDEYEKEREPFKAHFENDPLYPTYIEDDEVSITFFGHLFRFIEKDKEAFSALKFLYDKSTEYEVYCTHIETFLHKKNDIALDFDGSFVFDITEPSFVRRKYKSKTDHNTLAHLSKSEFECLYSLEDGSDCAENRSSIFFDPEHVFLIDSTHSDFDLANVLKTIERDIVEKIIWRKLAIEQDITDDEFRYYEKLNPIIANSPMGSDGASKRFFGLRMWDMIELEHKSQTDAFNTLLNDGKVFWYKNDPNTGDNRESAFRQASNLYRATVRCVRAGVILPVKPPKSGDKNI